MASISNLPRDLAEEVVSRLPMTSLRAVRSTCKKLNTLSKDRTFTKKHLSEGRGAAAKKKHMEEFQVIMMLEYRVYLMKVNLCYPCIERIGRLISLEDADRVEISQIFHCDGLLLCITKDISSLVVWNPYSGQTRRIEPINSYHRRDRYALGYEKKNSRRSHKLLRFVDSYDVRVKRLIREFEIYNLESDSWSVIDFTPDWDIEFFHLGLSLKGNTYWFAQEKLPGDGPRVITSVPDFLLCYDFTTERFGPRLPLPFHAFYEDTVALSSVREEQLAVLFQKLGFNTVKIWITTKIEPTSVSWGKLFLAVDMAPLTGLYYFKFVARGGSFFVDEKKKVAVVLDKGREKFSRTRNIAYIFGENGYYKQVDLGESRGAICIPLVCSYVPSSVQI